MLKIEPDFISIGIGISEILENENVEHFTITQMILWLLNLFM